MAACQDGRKKSERGKHAPWSAGDPIPENVRQKEVLQQINLKPEFGRREERDTMQRRIFNPWVALAALALAAGMARPAHAQGALQAFPEPGGTVLLTWLAAPDPAVVGYNVYRRDVGLTADKAALANPQPAAATTLLDAGPDGKGLPLGKPLVYFVRTVIKDASGKLSEGPNSGEASVTPQNPTVLPTGSFLYYDINTANPGSVTVAGNVLTIRASGSDLWDSSDGQTFLATPVAGNYQVTAQITAHPENVDPAKGNGFSKTAVEIRAGLFRGDPFAVAFTSVDRDPSVFFEGHKAFVAGPNHNFSQAGTGASDTTYPLWLRLLKQGTTITAFQSFDGTSYTQIGDPQDFGSLPAVTYVGLAIGAGNDGQYSIAKFDVPSIKIEPK